MISCEDCRKGLLDPDGTTVAMRAALVAHVTCCDDCNRWMHKEIAKLRAKGETPNRALMAKWDREVANDAEYRATVHDSIAEYHKHERKRRYG